MLEDIKFGKRYGMSRRNDKLICNLKQFDTNFCITLNRCKGNQMRNSILKNTSSKEGKVTVFFFKMKMNIRIPE